MSKLLTLKPFHYVYVIVVILIIGPFTVATMYSQDFFEGYVRTFIGPRLQRKFGFEMEVRRMYYRRRQPQSVFVIKNLKPDGEFAQLGVRNCDVPVGAYHMSDAALYRKLERSEGKMVVIHFVNCDEYESALESGEFSFGPLEHKIFPLTNQERFRFSTFCRSNVTGQLLKKSLCDFRCEGFPLPSSNGLTTQSQSLYEYSSLLADPG